MSLINGGIKGRILESGADSFGRWAYTKIRRNMGPPLTIIVTYQVVQEDPKQAGPTTYATQLYSLYNREGRQPPDHLRKYHAEDLVDFVKTCQARGEWIIVAGDFNEVLGLSTRGLTKLHSECNLIDACLDISIATSSRSDATPRARSSSMPISRPHGCGGAGSRRGRASRRTPSQASARPWR